MLQQNQFANITHLFYSGEYEEGEKEISKVIRRQNNNSNIYVNRALFLSQLGRDQQAILDLEKALQVNPKNYIAYFNLFSIFTKIVEDEQALSNLCCSLSCMYLIRAKMNKNIEDVNIAISYSHNNFEAHVLKGLLLLQSNLYQQSKQSFENALSLVPHSEVITHLRNVAIQKGNLEHGQSPIVAKESDKFNYRLMNSYRIVDGCDLNDEIDKKLAQFNRLYIDINSTAGTVTQKVIQDSHLSHKNSQQNIKIIYDSGLSTPLKTSQVHPEPGNIYIRSSIAHQEGNVSFVSCKRENLHQESFNSIHNEYAEKVQEKYEDVNLQSQQLDKQYGFLPQQAQCETVKIYEEPMNHQGFQSIISQPEQMQSQLKFEQQAQNSEHYNLIYPLDDNMKLKINVLNLQFLQITEEVQQSLTDVYCIINYNNGKGKLRTAAKQVQGQTCYWNQQFDPVDISQDPAYMKIKIYNKKYKSVRDEFLGDLEVLITTADLLKLPLYSKKGILGNLLIHLQLVEMVPSPTVKAEQEENLLE